VPERVIPATTGHKGTATLRRYIRERRPTCSLTTPPPASGT